MSASATEYIELKTTDGQPVYIRRNEIAAIEVVPASVRVSGHVKLYVSGYKFLIDMDKDELLQKLGVR